MEGSGLAAGARIAGPAGVSPNDAADRSGNDRIVWQRRAPCQTWSAQSRAEYVYAERRDRYFFDAVEIGRIATPALFSPAHQQATGASA
jgi:hypothetical protein